MAKIGQKRTTPKKKIKRKVPKLYELDRLFSLYIRAKANHTCEWCGKKCGMMHCHHGVVGRRYIRTRYEEDNACCLGAGCHNYLEDHPSINAEFFRKRLGSDRVEQLIIMAHSHYPVDKNKIKEELKEKLNER